MLSVAGHPVPVPNVLELITPGGLVHVGRHRFVGCCSAFFAHPQRHPARLQELSAAGAVASTESTSAGAAHQWNGNVTWGNMQRTIAVTYEVM